LSKGAGKLLFELVVTGWTSLFLNDFGPNYIERNLAALSRICLEYLTNGSYFSVLRAVSIP
jgi:hypothetical protein